MSLLKQLWLSVFVAILICLGGSFILMTSSAVNYLQTQLYQKNIDSANNLALSLSRSPFNPVTAEVQISSQFDTGFYQLIELTAPNGGTIIRRAKDNTNQGVPQWFVNLIPLEPQPGVANVSSGWLQVGDLSIQSSKHFAYQELWHNSLRLGIYFLITACLSGFIGFGLLRHLVRPLNQVIEQAQAISERRFITTPEPSTLEFKQLVSSMNQLSAKVKGMLEQETEHLHGKHIDSTQDTLTQLLGREASIAQIHAHLRRDDDSASGYIALIRLNQLYELNQLHGRDTLDALIVDIGTYLRSLITRFPHAIIGRLDGGDFVLLLPDVDKVTEQDLEILTQLRNILLQRSIPEENIIGSITRFTANEELESLLARLENGLEQSLSSLDTHLHHVEFQDSSLPVELDAWHTIFNHALMENNFQLNLFPVITTSHQLLHFEAPLRLILNDNQLVRAGQFIGWAKRANKMTEIDLCCLTLAFGWLQKQNGDIGINLSAQLLTEPTAQAKFFTVLDENRELSARLWLEIPEQGAFHHLKEFKQFVRKINQYKCKVGIEHAGSQFDKFGLLHDVGIDFIKIDAAFVHDIHNNHPNQIYLQGLVSLIHSIGPKVIAEGVATADEQRCVEKLGFDGLTGPAVGIDN